MKIWDKGKQEWVDFPLWPVVQRARVVKLPPPEEVVVPDESNHDEQQGS